MGNFTEEEEKIYAEACNIFSSTNIKNKTISEIYYEKELNSLKNLNRNQKKVFKEFNPTRDQPTDAFDYKDVESEFNINNWNDGALIPIHNLLESYDERNIPEKVHVEWEDDDYKLSVKTDKGLYKAVRYKHRGRIEKFNLNGEPVKLFEYVELLIYLDLFKKDIELKKEYR